MNRLFELVLIMLMACVTPAAAGDLADYKNTNQLVWDKQFKASVNHFFGGTKGSFLWGDDLISAQLLEALGGPPDDLHKLDDGLVLASACRAHSCPEKGAVILKDNGVVAAALISFKCHGDPTVCAEDPTLTIFLRDKLTAETATPIFESWANAKNAEAAALMGDEAERIPVLKGELVNLPAEG